MTLVVNTIFVCANLVPQITYSNLEAILNRKL